MAAVGDSYDGYDAKAAERLREDPCLAGEALRTGTQHVRPRAAARSAPWPSPADQDPEESGRSLFLVSQPADT
jgi:hypothetical protein